MHPWASWWVSLTVDRSPNLRDGAAELEPEHGPAQLGDLPRHPDALGVRAELRGDRFAQRVVDKRSGSVQRMVVAIGFVERDIDLRSHVAATEWPDEPLP